VLLCSSKSLIFVLDTESLLDRWLPRGLGAAAGLPKTSASKIEGPRRRMSMILMLGPNGQSNGCASFSNNPAFPSAFLRGEVDRLATRVGAAVRDRIGAELVTSHGDLVTEEIADAEVEECGVSVLSAGAASD
jgi:hypothetical protein